MIVVKKNLFYILDFRCHSH